MNEMIILKKRINRDVGHDKINLDTFALNPNKKHLWLQKIAIWIIKKLECYTVTPGFSVSSEILRFDVDRFIFRLKNVVDEIYQYINNPNIKYRLIVGSEDFSKIMMSEDVMTYFSFTDNKTIKYGSAFHVYGITINVQVVPWIKGIILVPDAI